jgi:peptide deformylase
MAIREILEVPDPRLKQVSAPVETFDDELRTLVSDMFDTMYDAPASALPRSRWACRCACW